MPSRKLTLKHLKKTMIVFKEKQYTRWDDTDALKRMRDSDILAERKKSGTLGDTAGKMGMGAALGGTVGSVIGGVAGLKRGGKGFIKGAKAARLPVHCSLVESPEQELPSLTLRSSLILTSTTTVSSMLRNRQVVVSELTGRAT